MENSERHLGKEDFRKEMEEILAGIEEQKLQLTPEAQELVETLKTEVWSNTLLRMYINSNEQQGEHIEPGAKINLSKLFTDEFWKYYEESEDEDGDEYYAYASGALVQNAGEMDAPRYCLRPANPNSVKNKPEENCERTLAVYLAEQNAWGSFDGLGYSDDLSDSVKVIGYLRKDRNDQIVFSNVEMIQISENLVQMHEGDASVQLKGQN